MYPDLSYILHAIFGTAPDNAFSIIKTFGLFLILSFLASAWVLRLEMRRKEREGIFHPIKESVLTGRPATAWEIASNALVGFILGFKLPYIVMHFAEFQQDAAAVLLSTRGTLIWGIAGAGLLGYLRYRDGDRKKLHKPVLKTVDVWPHERIGDITILAAIAGIAGSKLAAPLESAESFRAFLDDPLDQLFSGSGLAIYGGLILAFCAVLWYIRRKQIPALHMMDAVAPALLVGYAVGRIGCQLSGDGDWGVINLAPPPAWWFFPDWLWAYDYPHNVLNEGIPIDGCTWHYCRKLASPVFPTPVYETLLAFALAGVLWMIRRHIRIPGVLFFIYTILTGLERFWIERIRVNPDIRFAGIEATQAEYISVLLMCIGIAGILFLILKRQPQAS